MQHPEQYLKYAEECERLARVSTREQADAMLAIANAWRRRAEEAERKQRKDDAFDLAVLQGS